MTPSAQKAVNGPDEEGGSYASSDEDTNSPLSQTRQSNNPGPQSEVPFSGAADAATSRIIDYSSDDEDEDLVGVPAMESRRDSYMSSWVRRDFGNGLMVGQVTSMFRKVVTDEVYYLVRYIDKQIQEFDEEELLTREEVERFFYAKANASAAIWHYAENNLDY